VVDIEMRLARAVSIGSENNIVTIRNQTQHSVYMKRRHKDSGLMTCDIGLLCVFYEKERRIETSS
jgi:hypothetical protein